MDTQDASNHTVVMEQKTVNPEHKKMLDEIMAAMQVEVLRKCPHCGSIIRGQSE